MLDKGEHGGYIINGEEIRYTVWGFGNDDSIIEKGYLSDICDGFEVWDILNNNKVVKIFRPHTVPKVAKDANLHYDRFVDIEECSRNAIAYAEKLNNAWRAGCNLKGQSGNS